MQKVVLHSKIYHRYSQTWLDHLLTILVVANMIKESPSLHKIPYYDMSSLTLNSVDKEKVDYQDIMCVCAPTDTCNPIDGRPT
jgi:hypothetical protein